MEKMYYITKSIWRRWSWKKTVCALIALVLLLGISGCGSEKTPEPESKTDGLCVGFGRTDITPEISVPLSGFGNTSMRMSKTVARKLYATCIAITDADNTTVLLVSIDLQSSGGAVLSARSLISQSTGVPEQNIFLCATHTHAGPDFSSSEPSIAEYIAEMIPAVCRSAEDAMDNRKPAKMYAGSVETEGLNFVKHYQYVKQDGTVSYFGDNFGDSVIDSTTSHTSDVDQTMHLVKFTREGEKDIVLANWRAHPLLEGAANKYDVSADFVGAFREAMELKGNCQFAFFQGAAGNINSSSRIPQERRTQDSAEYGALLAGYAREGLEAATEQTDTKIRSRQIQLTADINHDTDAVVGGATIVRSVWTSTNDAATTLQAGQPYGIRSPYQANAIINRAAMAETDTMELSAVSIGGQFAIVTAPVELFDGISSQTEEQTAFQTLFTLGYTNGYYGYIPTAAAFEYTCYESDVCWFKPGIGEQIQDNFVDMLQQLYAETEGAS